MVRWQFPTALLVLTSSLLVHSFASSGSWTAEEDTELRKLMVERRDVLRTRAALIQAIISAGDGAERDIMGTRQETDKRLCEAELELAESKEERIEILQSYVKRVAEFEKLMEGRWKAATVDRLDYLAAQEALLKAKIDLQREQAK